MSNREQRNRICAEMYMIMTKKDNHNRYVNGNMTFEEILNIIEIIFYGSKQKSPPYLEKVVEQCWDKIINKMKQEIFLNSFSNMNI